MADKIVIRIQNPQSAKSGDDFSVPAVTVWYWHRIVPAVLILALMIWGFVMGLRSWRGNEADHPSAAAIPAAIPPVAPAPAIQQQQPSATAVAPVPEHTRPESTPVVANPSQATAEVRQPSGGAAIKSSAIRRLQLTSGLVDGEPVDHLSGTIPMNQKGLVKVFLFMETAGLKGKVLYHDWYWKDRLIAHARVPVTRPQQNSVTSKFIDRIMVGPWHALVVDEKKKVYGEASFEVR